MKKDIHPASYQFVVFHDCNNNFKLLTRSTIDVSTTSERIEWEDGNTYPVIPVHVSSASHPFYINKKMNTDEMSEVAKFYEKYKKKKE